MTMNNSRYRLHSSAFDRPDDKLKVNPKKVVFLSAEGVETEKDYFDNLNRYLDASVVQVEMLKHRKADGTSNPEQVLELLEEYIDVRENGIIPLKLPHEIEEKYSKQDIDDAISDDGTLDYQTRLEILNSLEENGIDIEYRRHLYKIQPNIDFFGIVIDRDHMNHSRKMMEDCIKKCAQNGFGCYISNPCFEFWLLLHLCDVNSEFSEKEKAALLDNKKISERHTVASQEVSRRARHKKHINSKVFDNIYYLNIKNAVMRANDFYTKYPDLLDGLGTNIPDLLREIGCID